MNTFSAICKGTQQCIEVNYNMVLKQLIGQDFTVIPSYHRENSLYFLLILVAICVRKTCKRNRMMPISTYITMN